MSYHNEEKEFDKAPHHQTEVVPAFPEAQEYAGESQEESGLKRQLKSRHMAMISIGGVM
jgi:amino acid permease